MDDSYYVQVEGEASPVRRVGAAAAICFVAFVGALVALVGLLMITLSVGIQTSGEVRWYATTPLAGTSLALGIAAVVLKARYRRYIGESELVRDDLDLVIAATLVMGVFLVVTTVGVPIEIVGLILMTSQQPTGVSALWQDFVVGQLAELVQLVLGVWFVLRPGLVRRLLERRLAAERAAGR